MNEQPINDVELNGDAQTDQVHESSPVTEHTDATPVTGGEP